MNYNAIADVGRSLLDLLKNNMNEVRNYIYLCSPNDAPGLSDIRLSLFLYDIDLNPHLRNEPAYMISPEQLEPAPLICDLYYLLTAYSPYEDLSARSMEEHQVLGWAMRTLYENPVLDGNIVKGSPAEWNETIRINLNHLTLDELNKLWSTFTRVNYRPSISYLVSPVYLHSDQSSSQQRVVIREMNWGDMQAIQKAEAE